nr:hypothetical protein [Streptomyces albicerus]
MNTYASWGTSTRRTANSRRSPAHGIAPQPHLALVRHQHPRDQRLRWGLPDPAGPGHREVPARAEVETQAAQ